MRADTVLGDQFGYQFVQRDLSFRRNPRPDPIPNNHQLAMPAAIALWAGSERAGLAPEPDQFVHELRRNAKMSCRFTVTVPFVNKGHNAFSQLNWMRFAHLRPPYLPHQHGITTAHSWKS